MLMNKEQADALCTIIALGFVSQNERTAQGKTLYLYDSATDAEEHSLLADILCQHFGINIFSKLENAKDAVTGRKIHPFVYALPCGNPKEARRLVYDDVKLYEADLLDIVQIAETAINSLLEPSNRFRGAYIGGFINHKDKEISLIGPSSLYLRKREHLSQVNPPPAALVETFIEYNKVTSGTKEFLKECTPTYNAGGRRYSTIVTYPDLTDQLILEGKSGDDQRIFDDGMVFSSCHGLVTSMYHHSALGCYHLNDGVCIELSLSDDTCKSASCIPCAIFATSQGSPASAAHFGRGDFWNLPAPAIRKAFNPAIEEYWRSFIIDSFVFAGSEILRRDNFNQVIKQMASLVNEPDNLVAIPEMFLDALTFEGSFSKKMIVSLLP